MVDSNSMAEPFTAAKVEPAHSGWLQSPWTWAAILIIALMPLAWPSVPPLTDLPGHMARYTVQLDSGRSPALSQWYSFEWAILPNLGVDLLVQFLAPVLGLRIAVKLVVLLIVAAQIWGMLLVSRAAHGHVSPIVLFALPLTYSASFNYGFVNFSLGIALATLGLAAWISPWLRDRPIRRWLVFAIFGCVLWICHLAAWAVFCLLAGCTEFVRRYEASKRVWSSLARGFVSASGLLLPQIASLALPSPEPGPIHGFFLFRWKAYYLINALQDRWESWDSISAVSIMALVIWAWAWRSFKLHRGLALGALVLGAAFVLLPQWVYGSAFADMRMVPIALIIALVAIRPAQHAPVPLMQVLGIMGLLFFGARMLSNGVSFAWWDRTIDHDLSVLDSVPEGSQMVSIVVQECTPFVLLGRDRLSHLPSYALIRRHAFANDQWMLSGGQLIRVHNPAVGPFQQDGSHVGAVEECGARGPMSKKVTTIPKEISLLWVVWTVTPVGLQGWQPVRQEGDSVLYRRAGD